MSLKMDRIFWVQGSRVQASRVLASDYASRVQLFRYAHFLHRCFPVNFAKCARTPFLQNTSWRLLLSDAMWGLKQESNISDSRSQPTVPLSQHASTPREKNKCYSEQVLVDMARNNWSFS